MAYPRITRQEVQDHIIDLSLEGVFTERLTPSEALYVIAAPLLVRKATISNDFLTATIEGERGEYLLADQISKSMSNHSKPLQFLPGFEDAVRPIHMEDALLMLRGVVEVGGRLPLGPSIQVSSPPSNIVPDGLSFEVIADPFDDGYPANATTLHMVDGQIVAVDDVIIGAIATDLGPGR